jgi:hypothetical protein
MNTYDTDARRLNVGTFWRNLRAVLRRWLDRERELVSLRNAVGMMSEARRGDAAEWHAMAEARRGDAAAMGEMRADALRLRWLTADHADPEVRERVRSICQSIPARGIGGARLDIDANIGRGAQRNLYVT